MSFFEELKRRNVFRVGIAYGFAARVVAVSCGSSLASRTRN